MAIDCYAKVGDLKKVRQLMRDASEEGLNGFLYVMIIDRLLERTDFGEAESWLKKFVKYQARFQENRNFSTFLDWGSVSELYSKLARKQLAAGRDRDAALNAKTALLLTTEEENYGLDGPKLVRSGALGPAYGAALGALTLVEVTDHN